MPKEMETSQQGSIKNCVSLEERILFVSFVTKKMFILNFL